MPSVTVSDKINSKSTVTDSCCALPGGRHFSWLLDSLRCRRDLNRPISGHRNWRALLLRSNDCSLARFPIAGGQIIVHHYGPKTNLTKLIQSRDKGLAVKINLQALDFSGLNSPALFYLMVLLKYQFISCEYSSINVCYLSFLQPEHFFFVFIAADG